ncbi:pseudaminic acid synthase [Acidovorax sp. ACV02]|uniref:pseudaminic acid synthase n=1 Tax=Acidovorax sp. ACV02 TaxID=2769310 RepID=UPI0017809B10|nr:pseudaminic acid synthase [Acidovorax sp. ACV02]MBD9404208.1 pseudaminic acid synthase [Acidovorax sp. ACV02]
MSQKPFQIAGRKIGTGHAPFVIAEMSGNHNHSLDRALAIVDAAAASGAHGLKIQTYTADTMTLPLATGEFFVSDPANLWTGRTLYDLYREAHTPWEWHEAIFERCRSHGIVGFSTPFDATAVDFLEGLGVPCYKISSFENTDLPLVRKVAATGKPLIISTGMATAAELDETMQAAREAGAEHIVLLKCTSTYPATPDNTHVRTIPHMRDLFGCEVGLSDHTMGVGAAVAGVALGATVIEKHFTLARADGGVDSTFSLEPQEFRVLVDETERAWRSLGSVQYGPTADELKSLRYRRSLYVVEDMAAGEHFTESNVRAIRPGLGLAPKYLGVVLQHKARTALEKGRAVSWDILA